jgi:hypothetical protein
MSSRQVRKGSPTFGKKTGRRQVPEDECGKPLYLTYEHSIEVAVRSSGIYGKSIRIYDCQLGNGFHLTTKSRFSTARKAS